jgi:hypothetical protein
VPFFQWFNTSRFVVSDRWESTVKLSTDPVRRAKTAVKNPPTLQQKAAHSLKSTSSQTEQTGSVLNAIVHVKAREKRCTANSGKSVWSAAPLVQIVAVRRVVAPARFESKHLTFSLFSEFKK